ncbi:unnamed protein product, partial [Iphiclides podalirius]
MRKFIERLLRSSAGSFATPEPLPPQVCRAPRPSVVPSPRRHRAAPPRSFPPYAPASRLSTTQADGCLVRAK